MSDSKTRMGACVCGAVTFTALNVAGKVGACHCKTCRQWGGGPFMELDCGTEVTFTGAEHISAYDSSEWADRGFCSKCGSHLFYRMKEAQQYMMPVGLFDEDSDLVFESQVFIDAKPHYYAFDNNTQNLTGEELFAQFAPPEE